MREEEDIQEKQREKWQKTINNTALLDKSAQNFFFSLFLYT
jgi:hypothetical protein